MKLIIMLFFVFSGPMSFSQQAGPADFVISHASRKLNSFKRKYMQYIETKEGFVQFNSILSRQLQYVLKDGINQVLVTQSYQADTYIDNDSSYCDVTGFMPIGYFTDIRSEGHKESVIFSAEQINNTIGFKSKDSSFAKPNKHVYNGVISDEIIAAMPLALHKVFTFKSVNPGLRYEEYSTTVTVEAKEEIMVPVLGKILCWRVRTTQGVGAGATEWYTVKDHIQVKKKFDFGNGNAFYRVLMLY